MNSDSEVHSIVLNLGILQDDHDYIEKIALQLGIDKRTAGEMLIREIEDSEEWKNYIQPINEWLLNRKKDLALEIPQ